MSTKHDLHELYEDNLADEVAAIIESQYSHFLNSPHELTRIAWQLRAQIERQMQQHDSSPLAVLANVDVGMFSSHTPPPNDPEIFATTPLTKG